MDHIDTLLLEAWNRIGAKVRRDRLAALKRSQRRFRKTLTAPMREWCLVIRSADTRIDPYRALILPEPDAIACDDPLLLGQPHRVVIDGRLVRRLTKPVMIPWPGVTYERAAAMCGRDIASLKRWAGRGVFSVEYFPEHKFDRTCTRGKGGYIRGAEGRNGRPYLWTPSPIDPNNWTGRTPHEVWGTLWLTMWEQFPEDYRLIVRREPRFRISHGRQDVQFRGWEFVCPGRLAPSGEFTTEDTENTEVSEAGEPQMPQIRRGRNADADARRRMRAERLVHIPCGRRCLYLYAPQTVWTLVMAMGEEMAGAGFDMPGDAGLAGQWHPGASDPVKDAALGVRSFACKKCWGVRSMCNSNSRGWNNFVTAISGGLLYGREVPRPDAICPIKRKHREYLWRRTRERQAAAASRAANG